MKNLSPVKFAIAVVFILVTAVISFTYLGLPKTPGEVPAADTERARQPDIDAVREKKREALEQYGRLPITFEPNLGQTDESVEFLSRGRGYTLFLTGKGATLSLKHPETSRPAEAVLKIALEGANTGPEAKGIGDTGGRTNYITGNDPAAWRTNVPNYDQVRFDGVYEGVDVVYYGNNRELEYDFVVEPGADPSVISLRYSGIRSAKIDKGSGELLLETAVGEVRQKKPFVYQIADGSEREIASSYHLEESGNGEDALVSFRLAGYDRTKELVIDPILVYGSYLGGSEFDEARAVAVDSSGHA